MKYFIPLSMKCNPMIMTFDNNDYIIIFEKEKDMKCFIRKNNMVVMNTIIINDKELNNLVHNVSHKIAVIKECFKEGFEFEEVVIEIF